MAMIRIDHLTFTYPNGSEPVFEDVSLQFDDEWRLGLIATAKAKRHYCGC